MLLIAGYLFSRTWHLAGLAMFFDEATHLLWAERLWHSASAAAPVAAGKLLQVALTAVTLRLPLDPLWTGRMTTVAVAGGAAWAAFAIGRRLGGRELGVLAAAFYLCCPFALVYDRMNLADAYASTFAGLTLLMCLRLLDAPGLVTAIGLGLAMAGSELAKATGAIAFSLPLAALGLAREGSGIRWRSVLGAYAVGLSLVAAPLALFLTRTGEIAAKAATESDRLALALENARVLVGWLISYWTPLVAFLVVLGAAWSLLRGGPGDRLLVLAMLLPVGVFAVGARQLYPRYVLSATIPALVLAARGASETGVWLARRTPPATPGARWLIAAIAPLPALAACAQIVSEPVRAPLPAIERFQYIEGWPSGYGWREACDLIRRLGRTEAAGVQVVTDEQQPQLAACFLRDSGVTVRRWRAAGRGRIAIPPGAPRVLLVTSSAPAALEATGAQPMAEFPKPGGASQVRVYRLLPDTP